MLKELLDIGDSDFSNMLNISRMTLYRWLNGESEPNRDNLEKIYQTIYNSGIKINMLKEELLKTKENKNLKILYYGAKNSIVGDITINKSDGKKDFGKGFYLGESLFQSASFVSNYNDSSVYAFDFKITDDIKIKEFDVSKEWMILISYFRGKIDEYSNSSYLKSLLDELKDIDVIIAPIADNTMYDILDSFSNGDITDLQTLHALSANWLGKQYVFLNDEAIKKSLKVIDRLYICNSEKNEYKTKKEESTNMGKNKVKLAKREYAGKGLYIEDLLK